MKGTIKFFDEMKGFGFIAGEDHTDYFVHHSALEKEVILNEDDLVTFNVIEGDRGLKAINVKKITKETTKKTIKEEE